ncbi:MAG: hypothetical protein KDB68_06190 [Planctomycetes bacterium]|nr:hypothetical protein [Planctomycetota bacterium]MCA8935778.1 hypothetical protein [Planctomycetota bacterium]
MKRFQIPAVALLLALLAGCAEYKEYTYKEYSISREQAYESAVAILSEEGYQITEVEENYVNDLPEIYLETDWNQRQVGSPYPGNDMRRRAYIKITTLYSERKPYEYQPLSEEDGERINEMNEELEKKADLEQTRVGIAVRLERRSDIKRPLEADWYYDGPDNYESAALMGRFEAAYGAQKHGGSTEPSSKSRAMKEEELRRNQGK